MVGEDYRSSAFKHDETVNDLVIKLQERKEESEQKNEVIS